MKSRKHLKKHRKMLLFILLILTIICIFSGIKIIKYILDSKENEKISDEISQSIIAVNSDGDITDEYLYNIDFETLKQQNSDTVAFLKVNGTDIENIVVQSTNNSYYLNHNFNKNTNSAGWIFADYRNKLDGTDKNIIIYGHNMRNGTMFSTLTSVLEQEWFDNESNKLMTFITENEYSIYEIFSVYQIKKEEYYSTVDFTEEKFKEFINTIQERSKFNFNVDLDSEDEILTLSTCAYSNQYRVVVHARKINND